MELDRLDTKPGASASDQANRIIGACRFAGIKADIAGGVFKGKADPHDIDIVVECSDPDRPVLRELLTHCSGVIKDTPDAPQPTTVEFYITTPEHYPLLLDALRSSTWECIKGRKFSGLTYRKLVLEANHPYPY